MQEQVTYPEDKICQEAPLPPDLDIQPQPSFHLINIYCWKLGDTSTCKSQPLSLRTSWCSFRGKPYTGQELHNSTGEVPHGICELASDLWNRSEKGQMLWVITAQTFYAPQEVIPARLSNFLIQINDSWRRWLKKSFSLLKGHMLARYPYIHLCALRVKLTRSFNKKAFPKMLIRFLSRTWQSSFKM